MKEYPQLSEMGVKHPGQIDKFTLSSLNWVDVLRIVYGRLEGSLLPKAKTYEFPRKQNLKTISPGTESEATVMETDAALRAAIAELDDLLQLKKEKRGSVESILDELLLLEEDFVARIAYIRDLAKH